MMCFDLTNDHFSAKNISISEPNFTKSERKVRFGQLFCENEPQKMRILGAIN